MAEEKDNRLKKALNVGTETHTDFEAERALFAQLMGVNITQEGFVVSLLDLWKYFRMETGLDAYLDAKKFVSNLQENERQGLAEGQKGVAV